MDIGPHVFPTRKYRLIHDRLLERTTETGSPSSGSPLTFVEPVPAGWNELALVHTAEYLAAMREGMLSREALAQLELPWSEDMVDGFRLMVGGTMLAARLACGFDDEFRFQ